MTSAELLGSSRGTANTLARSIRELAGEIDVCCTTECLTLLPHTFFMLFNNVSFSSSPDTGSPTHKYRHRVSQAQAFASNSVYTTFHMYEPSPAFPRPPYRGTATSIPILSVVYHSSHPIQDLETLHSLSSSLSTTALQDWVGCYSAMT
jgi:hypothetical protein